MVFPVHILRMTRVSTTLNTLGKIVRKFFSKFVFFSKLRKKILKMSNFFSNCLIIRRFQKNLLILRTISEFWRKTQILRKMFSRFFPVQSWVLHEGAPGTDDYRIHVPWLYDDLGFSSLPAHPGAVASWGTSWVLKLWQPWLSLL